MIGSGQLGNLDIQGMIILNLIFPPPQKIWFGTADWIHQALVKATMILLG
jgi:hypothetical protein